MGVGRILLILLIYPVADSYCSANNGGHRTMAMLLALTFTTVLGLTLVMAKSQQALISIGLRYRTNSEHSRYFTAFLHLLHTYVGFGEAA
jgi:hypothetical protein